MLEDIKILNYFYLEDGTFKSLSEILTIIEKIDIKILELILSSKIFLEQLNIYSLNEQEKNYLITILKNTYENDLEKIKI